MLFNDIEIFGVSLEQVLLTGLAGFLVSYFYYGSNAMGALYYGGAIAAVEIIVELLDSALTFLPSWVLGWGQMGIDIVSAIVFGVSYTYLTYGAFSLGPIVEDSVAAFVALTVGTWAHDQLMTPEMGATETQIEKHKTKKHHKKAKHAKRIKEAGDGPMGAGISDAEIRMNIASDEANGLIAPAF